MLFCGRDPLNLPIERLQDRACDSPLRFVPHWGRADQGELPTLGFCSDQYKYYRTRLRDDLHAPKREVHLGAGEPYIHADCIYCRLGDDCMPVFTFRTAARKPHVGQTGITQLDPGPAPGRGDLAGNILEFQPVWHWQRSHERMRLMKFRAIFIPVRRNLRGLDVPTWVT